MKIINKEIEERLLLFKQFNVLEVFKHYKKITAKFEDNKIYLEIKWDFMESEQLNKIMIINS